MWTIRIQGSDTVIKLFSTKAEAETYCQTLGANQQGTILFHNSKGKAKGSIATTQVHKKEAVKAEKPVIAAKPELKAKPEPKVTKPEVKVAKPVAAKKPEPKAKSEVKAKAPAKKSAPVKSSTKVVKKK